MHTRNFLLCCVLGLTAAVACQCPPPNPGGPDGSPDGQVVVPDASTCPAGAECTGVPPGGFRTDAGADGGSSTGLVTTDSGTLVLGSSSLELHFAWIANHSMGWVSKYDTLNNREIARYYSALPVGSGLHALNNNPSRTAVDLEGNVWVANRAATGTATVGSITKIVNDRNQCPDRNGNGTIETSGLLADGGLYYLQPGTSTNINSYDECVVLTRPYGRNDSGQVKGRALAISRGIEGSAGDVWAGFWLDKQIVKLDSQTGAVLPIYPDGGTAITLPPLPQSNSGNGPYGFAIDGYQRLWMAYAPGDFTSPTRQLVLGMVDTSSLNMDLDIRPPSGWGATSMYGIAIDGANRVWLAGWAGRASYVYSYERPYGAPASAGVWRQYYLGNGLCQNGTRIGRTRGIAVDKDGVVWVSADQNSGGTSSSMLVGFHAGDGGFVGMPYGGGTHDCLDFTTTNTNQAIGVGLDTEGDVWVNNYSGNAVVYERRDAGGGAQSGSYTILNSQPAGSNLYTYSDFTGYQLRNFTAPQGTYRHLVATSCTTPTLWDQIVWDATVPPGAQLQVYIKVADTILGLIPATRYGPFTTSPADLVAAGVPTGRYAQVELVFRSLDRQSSPELRSFHVQYHCEPIIN